MNIRAVTPNQKLLVALREQKKRQRFVTQVLERVYYDLKRHTLFCGVDSRFQQAIADQEPSVMYLMEMVALGDHYTTSVPSTSSTTA